MGKEISNWIVVLVGIIAVFLFVVFILIGWFVSTYNTFVVAKQDINSQWSNVKTEYQRRADLIYNMVEVTQSYAKFEKDTMTQVIQARSGSFGNTKAEEMQNLNGLESAFARLMVVFEKYPELKAIEQYNKLSEELQRTENRVQIARSDYNSLVRSYNILIGKFPVNMLSSMYGYKAEVYFENEQGTEQGVVIKME